MIFRSIKLINKICERFLKIERKVLFNFKKELNEFIWGNIVIVIKVFDIFIWGIENSEEIVI